MLLGILYVILRSVRFYSSVMVIVNLPQNVFGLVISQSVTENIMLVDFTIKLYFQ